MEFLCGHFVHIPKQDTRPTLWFEKLFNFITSLKCSIVADNGVIQCEQGRE